MNGKRTRQLHKAAEVFIDILSQAQSSGMTFHGIRINATDSARTVHRRLKRNERALRAR